MMLSRLKGAYQDSKASVHEQISSSNTRSAASPGTLSGCQQTQHTLFAVTVAADEVGPRLSREEPTDRYTSQPF